MELRLLFWKLSQGFKGKVTQWRKERQCKAQGHRLSHRGKVWVSLGKADLYECVRCGAEIWSRKARKKRRKL